MQEAYSWNSAFRKARQEYNTKIKIPKAFAGGVPSQFTESPMSLPLGANEVYRDQRPTSSLQIREYDDHYTVEMDKHNPDEGSAVKHALTDALPYTALAVGLGFAVFGGSQG
ncbi:hypothetical protein KU306_14400 [Haloferax larsenii]|uniref:Uncharacterized protein n=1 Tax=Haloferax larsenii TaxID=302484 RepID=A0ABY5RDG4_HALLR|nr:hypothetical protein [Haloferax larsenii]UVE50080.1 hypothetical protein KU306_14400 [Haloferax larsenii]